MFRVCKFGGSVLTSSRDICDILNIVSYSSNNDRLIIILSAFFGQTDGLISAIKIAEQALDYQQKLQEIIDFHKRISIELSLTTDFLNDILAELTELFSIVYNIKFLSPQNLDYLMSFGERLSALIVSEFFKTKIDCTLFKAIDIIKTDSNFSSAKVDFEQTETHLHYALEQTQSKCIVFSGFIGSDKNGIITTLGRNGSDYSAAIVASIIKAKVLEIWKDVDGIYTADPKIVPDARFIDMVSYHEMAELAFFGNKVIAFTAMKLVIDKNISIYVKNTKKPMFSGTLISGQTNFDNRIKGVTKVDNCVLFEIIKADNVTINNFEERIKNCLAKNNVHVLFCDKQFFICVKNHEATIAENSLNQEFSDEITSNNIIFNKTQNQSIIAIISHDVRYLNTVTAELFKNLAISDININAINNNSSKISTTCIVNSSAANNTIKTIHSFLLDKI